MKVLAGAMESRCQLTFNINIPTMGSLMTPASETDSSQWTRTLLTQTRPHFCLLRVTSFVFFSLFLDY